MANIEMPDDAIGEWNVDANEDGTGVVISFSFVGEDGVEVFTTAMPPEFALAFAAAVKETAKELL